MNQILRSRMVEENKFYKLLESNKQYRLQGWDSKSNKFVVGIIQGDPKEYKPYHNLEFKYFDTWKEAYLQLSQ